MKSKPGLKNKRILLIFGALSIILVLIFTFIYALKLYQNKKNEISMLQIMALNLGEENEELKRKLAENLMSLSELENQDPYRINLELNAKIELIQDSYQNAVAAYEQLLRLKEVSQNTSEYDKAFTDAVVALSQKDYESANSKLNELTDNIQKRRDEIAQSFVIPQTVPVVSTPPDNGYSQQVVDTSIGNYLVSIVAGELSATKIIVDTASSGTCTNDCPVLPLSEYVSRNAAFAGINGSYFCPKEYPSCAGKTNSFDTLLMNKDKIYFNSDNNVYSSVPAVIFGGGYIRFVGASSDWGRDTSIDSMIANQPLLVSGGNIVFGGDGDPKKGSKAGRSFVASKDNTVYIGVVHNATVAESAIVLKEMGMQNALNLDSGGSTALWSGGYKVGPGRNIPNAILFVRK